MQHLDRRILSRTVMTSESMVSSLLRFTGQRLFDATTFDDRWQGRCVKLIKAQLSPYRMRPLTRQPFLSWAGESRD